MLAEVIEPRKFKLGGWLANGFVSKFGRVSVGEVDREEVKLFLSSKLELKNVHVSHYSGRVVF